MKSFFVSLLKWVSTVIGASIAGSVAIWMTTLLTADQVIKSSGPALSSFAQAVRNELTAGNFIFLAAIFGTYLSYKYRHKFPSYRVSIEIERVPTPQPARKAPKLIPVSTTAAPKQSTAERADVAGAVDQLLEAIGPNRSPPSDAELKHQKALDALAKQLLAPVGGVATHSHASEEISAEDKVLLMYDRMGATEMPVVEIASILGLTVAAVQRAASNLHADGAVYSYQLPVGGRTLKLTQSGLQRIKQLRRST